MNKLCFIITFSLSIFLNALPMNTEDQSIIPGASYSIEVGFTGFINGRSGRITHGTKIMMFLTFNGDIIRIIDNRIIDGLDQDLSSRLDPNAPKPRPVKYRIIAVDKMDWTRIIYSGVDYYICFYDKHDYEIIRYLFCAARRSIKFFISDREGYSFLTIEDARSLSDFPLDLSIAVEERDESIHHKGKYCSIL